MHKNKIIFHIDINGFFASAEQARKPELRDKIVLICANSPRSIVSALSVGAKQLGFMVGEPLFKQPKNIPYVTVLPDLEYYINLSERFFKLIATYTPKLEVGSIDECYVDATPYLNKHKMTPYELAKKMQDDVFEKLGLPVSVGISTNKLVAKIAGEIDKKKMSIYILSEDNVKEKLWPLHVGKLMMVGYKTKAFFNSMGIETVGDLMREYEGQTKLYDALRKHIGIIMDALIAQGYGKGDDHIEDDYRQLKGVQNEVTPPNKLSTYEEIENLAKELSEFVSLRLKERNLMGSVVRLILKNDQKQKISMQVKLEEPTNSFDKIFWEIRKLIDKLWKDWVVRLVGVSVSDIVNIYDYKSQLKIDEMDKVENKIDPLEEIINDVNFAFASRKIMTLEQYENSPTHRGVQEFEKRKDYQDEESPIALKSLRAKQDKIRRTNKQ